MDTERPFNFRDDYLKGDFTNPDDRLIKNRLLKRNKIPVTINCLDVLISLITLPMSERTFDKIKKDMVTLTTFIPVEKETKYKGSILPNGPFFNEKIKKTDPESDDAKKKLNFLLQYLLRKKMVTLSKKKLAYSITSYGKKVMADAKAVLNPRK